MTTIIAGRFQQQEEAQKAVSDLMRAGFGADKTATFFVNPQGQHGLYPIGGDQDASPGSEGSGMGAAAGAAAGGAAGVAVGLMTAPLIGPAAIVAATGVGAYVGSLYGALSKTDDTNTEAPASEQSARDEQPRNEEGPARDEDQQVSPRRASGMLVAVATPSPAEQDNAIRVLRGRAVINVERAEGTIVDGKWTDYNPLTQLTLV